jgi:2-polyprenyl-3-methyl-5-hydroxy-6-metoxy-1,4-benzoquinol methylase
MAAAIKGGGLQMLYGCQGSYLSIGGNKRMAPGDIVTLRPESGPSFQAPILQTMDSILLKIEETYDTGNYMLWFADVSNNLLIIPRYVDWANLPELPLGFSKPLCEWANSIQYQNAAGYDQVVGRDFVKSLPTDWGDHLLSLGVGFDDKVLDIGTGTGRARLSAIKRGYQNVFGLDASEDCLQCQRYWQELLGQSYVEGQLQTHFSLDDHAGSFSAVILSSALHHIADIDGFLSFCSRLLKSGGVLIASMEPINKRKFHSVCGHDTTVDLAEVCEIRRTGTRQVTRSVTLVAEFWDGSGFTYSSMEDSAKRAGLELLTWDVCMWTSLLVYNFARNYLPPDADDATRVRFDALYQKSLDVDSGIKEILPDFARENFYCTVMMARKSANL